MDGAKNVGNTLMGYGLPVVLLAVGIVLKGIETTQREKLGDAALWVSLIGDFATVVGSLAVGQRFGRQQTNEALRVKLETAFRRTARLYERLTIVQASVGDAGSFILASVPSKDPLLPLAVDSALGAVAVRLDEQITTYDNALDEWYELVPDEVDRLRERLGRSAAGTGRGIARG